MHPRGRWDREGFGRERGERVPLDDPRQVAALGLVNALDPHVVTIGGLGRDLLEVAGEAAGQAYLAGLMSFRTPAPPLIPARLGDEAPILGAAEEAFSLALSDEGLKNWMTRDPEEG